MTFESHSREETIKFAADMAAKAEPGEVFTKDAESQNQSRVRPLR